ncbi:hypothetical protein GCM10011339_03760 [Echinicola rosea]|uniref:Uncharacterized protein n=1 Tax=Echinicola rosea TaxID=1807691 RepID=A0ABQ1UH69_9BACT|nr:hypothetical protein GCM10011339_03760 [Echinicola rosea]
MNYGACVSPFDSAQGDTVGGLDIHPSTCTESIIIKQEKDKLYINNELPITKKRVAGTGHGQWAEYGQCPIRW